MFEHAQLKFEMEKRPILYLMWVCNCGHKSQLITQKTRSVSGPQRFPLCFKKIDINLKMNPYEIWVLFEVRKHPLILIWWSYIPKYVHLKRDRIVFPFFTWELCELSHYLDSRNFLWVKLMSSISTKIVIFSQLSHVTHLTTEEFKSHRDLPC